MEYANLPGYCLACAGALLGDDVNEQGINELRFARTLRTIGDRFRFATAFHYTMSGPSML